MLTADDVAQQSGKPVAEVKRSIELARRSISALKTRVPILENGIERVPFVTRNGVGPLKTEFGRLLHYDFTVSPDDWNKYSVIFAGDVSEDFSPLFNNDEPLRMRIDSGCETGQMFGDITCECRAQLNEALRRISETGGLVVNIPTQDGRGFGLDYKLASLYLQESLGVNTVQAFELLTPAGPKDIRNYGGVIAIMKFLGIEPPRAIRLMSNNEKKQSALLENGYRIEEESLVIAPTQHTERHLRAKQDELGHKGLVDDKH